MQVLVRLWKTKAWQKCKTMLNRYNQFNVTSKNNYKKNEQKKSTKVTKFGS